MLLGPLSRFFAAMTLGWALVGLVVVWPRSTSFWGFAPGCFVYLQLNKLGVPASPRAQLNKAAKLAIERLALVIVLAIFCGATYYGLRLHIRRMNRLTPAQPPTLLYFRGDSCAVCPAQTRAIDQLASLWPDSLQIERIDAEHDMETAARYSVFTLPTTIWIDGDGRVRRVNYGLADADKLGRQLSLLAAIQAGPNAIGIKFQICPVCLIQSVPCVPRGVTMSIPELISPAALADMNLTHQEIKRYSRHLIMPEVGMTGQKN